MIFHFHGNFVLHVKLGKKKKKNSIFGICCVLFLSCRLSNVDSKISYHSLGEHSKYPSYHLRMKMIDDQSITIVSV